MHWANAWNINICIEDRGEKEADCHGPQVFHPIADHQV